MINFNLIEQFRTENNLAKIFGFIIYTDSHSNIIRVLRDQDYWNGFDEDSQGWIVFSVKPAIGNYNYPDLPPGFFGMMVPIWKEPKVNLEILRKLDLKSTEDLPLFVAFNILNDEEVERIIFKLRDESMDSARNSIKDIITSITRVVRQIDTENLNKDEVFRNVEQEIKSKIFYQNLKGITEVYAFLKSLI